MLAYYTWIPRFNFQHTQMERVVCCRPAISGLGRWRKENQKFKYILRYLGDWKSDFRILYCRNQEWEKWVMCACSHLSPLLVGISIREVTKESSELQDCRAIRWGGDYAKELRSGKWDPGKVKPTNLQSLPALGSGWCTCLNISPPTTRHSKTLEIW